MAKWMNDAGADAALAWWTDADLMILCSAQPATYAEATATYALADVAPTYDAITNGTVSGRKRGVQAQTGVTVDGSGTGTHIALVKTGDSTLRYVTTCPGTVVAAAGTVDIGAWAIEVEDPS
jgi:hypothetical protein